MWDLSFSYKGHKAQRQTSWCHHCGDNDKTMSFSEPILQDNIKLSKQSIARAPEIQTQMVYNLSSPAK